MTETAYVVTIEEPSGAIIAQEDVQSGAGPMDALRIYAENHGFRTEHEDLDYSRNGEYWQMVEADGTRIVVEKVAEGE